ncbi:MAG TPA: SDR family oxidoreductase [Bryobacteraceae bacterium]|jgi:NAD(P)-dependent dehydrogenase (short-subunit alcohol dehydrogenase family)
MPNRPEVVVITGASAGAGRATARRFARENASIGLLARGTEGLEAARAEVERCGGRALAIPTDVADPEQVEAAAETVEREFGPIDIWVNNAMTTVFSPFLEITPEEYRRATEVTYLGFVYGTMAALKRMVPRDRGVIVQAGSALAYRSIPLQAPYCGAKAAIRGFTDSVRTELLHQTSRVHLTMVQMPALNTPQFDWCLSKLPNDPQPVPPIFQPEVAAEAIFYAAHQRRREIYVGRTTVLSILANKFVPGLLDRYLAKTGYQAQQTDHPVRPGRSSNLFQPLPGDYGAHGEFDSRASARSPQFWADTHRGGLALLAIGIGAVVGTILYRGRS